jgi:hypothetical protein
MAMTLGRRIAVLVVAVLMALMMAMPTASAAPGGKLKGWGHGEGAGDVAHPNDNGNHTANGGGRANNPHCTFSCD